MERTTASPHRLRIAAMGDLHVSKHSQGAFQPLFGQISNTADVLALCGDFTDYGLPEEARVLVRELTAAMKIPVIAVLGNHDYEGAPGDSPDPRRRAACTVLDGEATEYTASALPASRGLPAASAEARSARGVSTRSSPSFRRRSMKR